MGEVKPQPRVFHNGTSARQALGTTALVVLMGAAAGGGAPPGQEPAELLAAARVVGELPAWENEHVRVWHEVLEYPKAERRAAESRPVVLYLRVERGGQPAETRLLDAPQGVRSPWRPGVVPRGVRIDVLTAPPPPSAFGEPSANPPRGAVEEGHAGWGLVLATFPPMDFTVGTGPLPSVTVFLSDGVVDVSHGGTRRRMGVRAGDAFWFEAATRLTVRSDDPVAAALVQLAAR